MSYWYKKMIEFKSFIRQHLCPDYILVDPQGTWSKVANLCATVAFKRLYMDYPHQEHSFEKRCKEFGEFVVLHFFDQSRKHYRQPFPPNLICGLAKTYVEKVKDRVAYEEWRKRQIDFVKNLLAIERISFPFQIEGVVS